MNTDRVRHALRKFGSSALIPTGVITRIAKKAGLHEADVVRALGELKATGEVKCQAWDLNGRPVAKLFLSLAPEPLKEHEIRWETVLKGFLDQGVPVLTLLPCAGVLQEMPQEDMVRLVEGLICLRRDMGANPSEFMGCRKFDVSARYLLGSSKLLKVLPSRALTEFGIPVERLEGPPRYVVVAGATSPKAVILVENPHAFESAVLADQTGDYCWIATYGYGLSNKGEGFGDQLAELVENKAGVITLSRREMFTDFKDALRMPPGRIFFWGDLDIAGLDIYRRLKKHLSGIRLSGLYRPMIEELISGGGHPYRGVQKDRQNLGSHRDEEISKLASLCATRGIDQERVQLLWDDVGSLAGTAL